MLQRVLKDEGKNWDQLLPYIFLAYREVPQTSITFSPFKLIYGLDVHGPLDIFKIT